MKEVMAIIRPKMVTSTKDALEKLGYPAITAVPVLGRGKQRGLIGEVDVELRPQQQAAGKHRGMKYIPKRQLLVVVKDSDVDSVAAAIIAINKTGQFGDGKIFVSPVEEGLRIRTGETGEASIL